MERTGHRRYLAAAAAVTLAAACGCAHTGRAAAEEAAEREGIERIRALMYADQDLDDLMRFVEMEGDAGRAVQLLNEGRAKEAAAAMTMESIRANGPAAVLLDALIKQTNGDAKGAEIELRAVLHARQIESRFRLWAAHALRQMGAKIDEDVADEMLGVVAEAPMELGIDSMAVYPDGNVRYINQTGAITLYDPSDGRLADVVAPVEPAAKAAFLKAPLVAEGKRPPLVEDEFRITFLTPRGPRRVRESFKTLGTGRPYDQVYKSLEGILVALTELQFQEPSAQR